MAQTEAKSDFLTAYKSIIRMEITKFNLKIRAIATENKNPRCFLSNKQIVPEILFQMIIDKNIFLN